jgi:glycosyltransferase involved in cell wall biosynthesis
MRLGIDASNLRSGGGVTHLVGVLSAAEPAASGFTRVTVWGGADTLARLSARDWLEPVHEAALDGGLVRRLLWQRFDLTRRAAAACDVLLVPGGTFAGSFRPFVTISRNALPFEPREMRRYGLSARYLRLRLLRVGQAATFRRAEGVVFLTRWAEEKISAAAGPRRGASALIPHGVDVRFFREPRPQRPASAYSAERPFRLLYVSIVDLYKHQGAVVEAVARLRAAGLPVTLDLVGEAYPPAARRLEWTLRRLDPEGAFVRRGGAVPHAELPETYAAADAFVFASSCENMPNILLEAMAAGLPIASSNRGPMPEVLGAAGAFFDPEDVDSIARSLRTLIEDAGQRERWAAEAHRRALAFSWRKCAGETLDFAADVARRTRRI